MSGNLKNELCEKLRKWVDCKHDMVAGDGFSWLYELTSKEKSELLKIADEIEAEIDSRYMLLPVDADGVPIRVGDVMCSAGIREKGHKVIVSAIFEDGFVEYGSDNGLIGPLCQEDWVHAKPRTLTVEQVREAIDDVLHDVVSLCFNTWKKPSAFSSYDVDDVMASGNMDDFAKELHELMGDGNVAHGTLTAEQVREAIERHSAWTIGNGPIFRDGAYEEIAAELEKVIV